MPNTIVIAGRILLVDDQPANLRVVTTLLKRQGYEVATATDGKSALEECHRFRPDLILLDMIMPRFDGRATISAIRRNPHLADLKVFAISGTAPSAFGIPTGPQGIDRWFPKPVNPEELVREITRELRDA